MVRALLVRGMLAGLVAGVLLFVFQYFVGEPALERALAYEEQVAGDAEHGVELVSRGVQSTIGLGVAVLIYGVAVGGLLALVYAAVRGRVGGLGPRATAALLAGGGFVCLVLVPFLKYPANPPASTDDGTIGQRTGLYLVMIVMSVVLAVVFAALARRLVERLGTWNGVVLASTAFAVVAAGVAALLPAVNETPVDFPAAALYDFRVASLGGQLVVWVCLGVVFGALVDGGSLRLSNAPRAAAGPSA